MAGDLLPLRRSLGSVCDLGLALSQASIEDRFRVIAVQDEVAKVVRSTLRSSCDVQPDLVRPCIGATSRASLELLVP